MCLNAKGGGGRIDAESETFVAQSIGVDEEQNSAAELMGCLKSRREGGGQEAFVAVAIPLDLRNATRDPEKRDEQNRQGCGVGAVGEPAPTLTKEFVPGVAVGIHGDVAHTLNQAGGVKEDGTGHGVPIVTHSLRAEGHDASEDGTGRGVPVAWDEQINAHVDISGAVIRGGDGGRHAGVMALAIRGRGNESSFETRTDGTANALLTPNGGRAGVGVGAVAYSIQAGATRENPESGPDGVGVQADVAYTIEARQEVQAVAHMAVRRLTPVECERLQGFADGYTDIKIATHRDDCRVIVSDEVEAECDCGYRPKPAADGPRYKALGNSMAVPCMAWIGRRIKEAYAND
jgi:DNA (cytosine-5)-methyltransferase 1